MMHSAEISQNPLAHICVKHNFTTRKAYFFQIKQTANDNALTCPEQPTVTLAYSDCVERLSSNIQWAVLNEEVCLIQREEVEREKWFGNYSQGLSITAASVFSLMGDNAPSFLNTNDMENNSCSNKTLCH